MEPNLPISAAYYGDSYWIDEDGKLWFGRLGNYRPFSLVDAYTKAESDARYITTATNQAVLPGNKDWQGVHHFDTALAIPAIAPASPIEGKAYIYAGEFGATGEEPESYVLPVATPLILGGVKGGGTGITIDGDGKIHASSPSNLGLGTITASTIPVLNSNGSGFTIPSATTALAGAYPAAHFSKVEGIAFGTTAGTYAQGNDSRILNGQTAFGWGNHAGLYVPIARQVNTGTHLLGGGQLNANLTIQFKPLMDNYILDSGNNSRIRFGSTAGNDDFQMRLAYALGSFVFRNTNNVVVADINYNGVPKFVGLAGTLNRLVAANSAGLFSASTNVTHNGALTVNELIATQRLRIPSGAPSSPQDGDMWYV